MIRRTPRSTPLYSSAASDVYKRQTTYGKLGIKVWIMKGEVYGKRELSPLVGLSLSSSKSKGGNKGRKQRRR